ncbi:MAG: VWA domain-containing protein [Planctomycetes bacterium]|nr:VWA domain-containing protein [Planctomycetota bacterium]
MIFLNPTVLLALSAVSIPIIIHFLHRRNAETFQWGAMRFLQASLAARNRRIMLEEMLLMALRCMAVALVAMAAARPFLPADSAMPWVAVLPVALGGAASAGAGMVTWDRRPIIAWALFALAALLLSAALYTALAEYTSQEGRWAGNAQARDVALIIDGSLSMSMTLQGKTNFERALEDAEKLIEQCPPGDAICLIEAGPMPLSPTAGPITDRAELRRALQSLRPTGGAMDLPRALSLAASALTEGQNPSKEIYLLTDGQRVGWALDNEAKWKFLASTLGQMSRMPRLVVRTLPLAADSDNCAVCGISSDRQVVGADRPLKLSVEVANAGASSVKSLMVYMSVDGRKIGSRQVSGLRPGARESVDFRHLFGSAGPHVVTAKLAGEDDLTADNTACHVVNVLRRLPVLIVEGDPSERPLSGAASFIVVALSPLAQQEREGKAAALLHPTVMPLRDIGSLDDLSPYRVVALADVSRLPPKAAALLARFIKEGGGLLITPGERCFPEFYNSWAIGQGQRIPPAKLTQRVRVKEDETLQPDLKSFSHPALTLLADADRSDAGAALVRAYWRMELEPDRVGVSLCARLTNGAPMLAERKLGEGHVLMTAFSLGRRDTTFPTLKAFVPLVHELTYYLAAPALPQLNVKPGSQVAVRVGDEFPGAAQISDGKVEVTTPWGAVRQGAIRPVAGQWQLTFAATREPGLYRFELPSAEREAPEETAGFPFVVERRPEESFLDPLTQKDMEMPRRYLNVVRVQSTDSLLDLVRGEAPGSEIWQRLVALALLAALLEVALARWITLTRRTHTAQQVEFGENVADAEAVRAHFEAEEEALL